MIQPRGVNAYRQTEVQSRTPLELVVMLYDGALRFLATATDAIERNDIRARRDALNRVLAIVSELQSTLDVERGGEVAEKLDELYGYMIKRVMDATITNDAEPLAEVERLTTTLRGAWMSVAAGAAPPPVPPVAMPPQPVLATP